MKVRSIISSAIIGILTFLPLLVTAQTGPAGIGNEAGSGGQPRLIFEVTADSIAQTDGTAVGTWSDLTSNGFDLSAGGGNRPTYRSAVAALNNQSAIEFDGSNDILTMPAQTLINASEPQTERTITAVFRTGANVTNRQVIWEEGGATRGLNIYVYNGNLYVSGWNLNNDDGGATTPWGHYALSTAATTNTAYVVSLVYDSNSTLLEMFVNSSSVASQTTNVGDLFDHGDDNGVGQTNGTSYFEDGSTSTSSYFGGYIAHLDFYSNALNEAQIRILHNALGEKYGIAQTNDYYSNTNYLDRIVGIGQFSATENHTAATTSLLSVTPNSGLVDGDYVMLGHDGADVTLSTTDAPANKTRLTRVWRANVTGTTPQSIDIDVDVTNYPLGSGQSYNILVDGDGTFSSGATVYTGTVSGNTFTAAGVSVSDGQYITFAKDGFAPPVSIEYDPSTLNMLQGNTASSAIPNVIDNGGATVTSWAINGVAPTGISINSSNGQISVDATATVGNYELDIDVTNSQGTTTFASAYTVNVQQTLTDIVYDYPSQSIYLGESITTATPTPSPNPSASSVSYSWDLPTNPYQGLNLNTSTGSISGTPTTAGTIQTTITGVGSGTLNGTVYTGFGITITQDQDRGGVGEITNTLIDLRANTITGKLSGDPVSSWSDLSTYTNNASQTTAASQPTYQESGIGGKPSLSFDGTDDYFDIANTTEINNLGAGYINQRLFSIVIETGADVTSRQVIFKEGGGTRAFVVYIDAGTLYVLAYNDANDDDTSPWTEYYATTSISANTSYVISFVYDYPADLLTGFLNGSLFASTTGTDLGNVFNHTGDIAVGREGADAIDYHDGAGGGSTNYFAGEIAEFAIYDGVYNDAQRSILESALGAYYGISISGSKYTYTTHAFDVGGIGRVSAEEKHIQTTSNTITVSNAGLLNGEYVALGHNNSGESFLANDIPGTIDSRISRVWRVDITGAASKTVDLDIDVSNYSKTAGQNYRVLIDSDGTFASGATIVSGSLSGNTLTVSGQSISDGDYITIAKTPDGSATAPVSLTYAPNDTLIITSGSSGTSVTPVVDDGGSGISSYAIAGGGAAGISINSTTGEITANGTTATGEYVLNISATNSVGTSTFNSVYTVIVSEPITALSVTPSDNVVSLNGNTGDIAPSPTPASPPAGGTYTYSWNLGTNPYNGISLNTSTGVISGTPTTLGLINGTLTVTGSGTASGTRAASFTINVIGNEGPGSVGDNTSLLVWLSSSRLSLNDGDGVSAWDDSSNYANNAAQGTGSLQPLFKDDASASDINGRGVLRFDGTDDVLNIANANEINTGGPYSERTFGLVFKTGADVTTRQMLYEEGGTVNGFSVFISNGSLYFAAWSDSEGWTTGGTIISVSSAVTTNTSYYMLGEFDEPSDRLEMWVDGSSAGSANSIGLMAAHSGEIGIGAIQNDSRDDSGDLSMTSGRYFAGDITEFFMYESILGDAQKQSIQNYVSAAYNLGLPGASYAYSTTHGYEVAGAEVLSTSQIKTIIQSNLLTIDAKNISSTSDGVFVGHDNAAFTANESDVPSGIENRMNRVWRMTVTGAPGVIDLSFNTSGFTVGSDSELRLLVAGAGTGGNFSDASTSSISESRPGNSGTLPAAQAASGGSNIDVITGTRNGDNYTFNNVSANDGDYVTLGSTSNSTVLPVELTDFNVRETNGGDANITWKTATERENYGFYLYRKYDPYAKKMASEVDTTWSQIAFIDGNGTTTQPNAYQYIDGTHTIAGDYLYRLVQEDYDGDSETFDPVRFKFAVPDQFKLSKPYPNPFNPVTQFSYTLKSQSKIKIDLFNVIGRHVQTLVDAEQFPGRYKATLNGSQLSSGVYIIRMVGGGQIFTKKITLIK